MNAELCCAATSICLFEVLDWPLESIVSKDSSILTKTIAAFAIGVFSLISLGAYAVYSYLFFAHRNVTAMYQELEKAVKAQDYDRTKALLEQTPALKKYLDVILPEDNDGEPVNLALLLPIATTNQDKKMVELLVENGASPNAASRSSKSSVEIAIRETGNVEILKFLVEHGGTLENEYNSMLCDALRYKIPNRWDVLKFIIEKVNNVNIEVHERSALARIAKYYEKEPEICTELLTMMLQKGAKLIESDNREEIPPEALKIIDNHHVKPTFSHAFNP